MGRLGMTSMSCPSAALKQARLHLNQRQIQDRIFVLLGQHHKPGAYERLRRTAPR